MSRHPAFKAVSDMEGTVADVERWGEALIAIGATDAHIAPGVVLVIGWAIKHLGDNLDIEWRNAFKDVGGEA